MKGPHRSKGWKVQSLLKYKYEHYHEYLYFFNVHYETKIQEQILAAHLHFCLPELIICIKTLQQLNTLFLDTSIFLCTLSVCTLSFTDTKLRKIAHTRAHPRIFMYGNVEDFTSSEENKVSTREDPGAFSPRNPTRKEEMLLLLDFYT